MNQPITLLLCGIIGLNSIHQIYANWPDVCKTNDVVIINNKCYEFHHDKTNFINANANCEKSGGHLAIIVDENTRSQISGHDKFLQNRIFWIGISDAKNEGNFIGVDGSTIFFPRNVWLPGEPNNSGGNEDCVVIQANSIQIYDVNCKSDQMYICEYTNPPCNMKLINIPDAVYEPCYKDKDIPYNTTIHIRCQNNYFNPIILKGPSSITCGHSGKWSELPECVRGCPKPDHLPNADLLDKQTIYNDGIKVTYVCDDGYVAIRNPRKAHFTSTCKDNGLWDPPIQGCTLEKHYSVGNLELAKETSITLPCLINVSNYEIIDGEREKERENATFLWYKNSRLISFENDKNYDINSDGTLTLFNVNQETVGFYICFQVGNITTPAKMGFNLKMKPEFCDDTNEEVHTVTQEGESALLLCPHDSSYNSFTWFKNGKRYYVNGNQILFPDGSLYFSKVDFQDQDTYVCQMQKRDSFCTRNRTTTLTVMALSESICGKSYNTLDHHPWAVSLWLKDEMAPFCYGTLIHESWVITTAHCLAGFNRNRKFNLFVRFYNGNNMETEILDISVKTVKIHPKYSKKLHVNDVGLLQLNQPVLFSTTIRPICLTETDFTKKTSCDQSPSLKGTVVGWGPLEKHSYVQNHLLAENMTLANIHNACFPACFPTDLSYFNNIFCSEKTIDSQTTFAGDAGSPFQVSVKGKTFLLGIYSWGERASLLGEYDYFTKMSYYVPWVKAFINDPIV